MNIFGWIQLALFVGVLLALTNGSWFVKPLSSTNQTTLDGERIQPNVFHPLSGERRLGMSTRCEILLRVITD